MSRSTLALFAALTVTGLCIAEVVAQGALLAQKSAAATSNLPAAAGLASKRVPSGRVDDGHSPAAQPPDAWLRPAVDEEVGARHSRYFEQHAYGGSSFILRYRN